ncbi:hypothetical protein AK812_SmicGene17351 [Symbiodinium microadriaticum]|uniref:Uncharacterized protein n=1 Tax=Symbiodinium microadriaticum TaxID=2951 RepID=A0A1Q9DY01_SYMMI|nr:hypothetical protein AK812_SmicGene17351 [Symbiodinium microadriaticum]
MDDVSCSERAIPNEFLQNDKATASRQQLNVLREGFAEHGEAGLRAELKKHNISELYGVAAQKKSNLFLFLPMNPSFQKTVLGYVALQVAAVIALHDVDKTETGQAEAARPSRRNPVSTLESKGRNVFERLEGRQLPGDGLVSRRFQPRRNLRPLIFAPFAIYVLFENAHLNYELEVVSEVGNLPNSANSTDPCFLGNRARDIFTKELYCPMFASQSFLGTSFVWYGLFLITIAFAWLMGMSIGDPAAGARSKKDPPDPHAPIALVRFLDCSRAKYDGWHLLAYFVTITLMIMLAFTLTSFAASLSDQGDITPHPMRGLSSLCQKNPGPEPKTETETLLRTEIYPADQLTAVAMRLKALVRRQMHVTREMSKNRQSSLAEALLCPIMSTKWALGGDEEDVPVKGISFYQWRICWKDGKIMEKSFDADLEEIFRDVRGPETVLRARDGLQVNMIGNTDQDVWQAHQHDFQKAKADFVSWLDESQEVNIFEEYDFCPIISGYRPRDDSHEAPSRALIVTCVGVAWTSSAGAVSPALPFTLKQGRQAEEQCLMALEWEKAQKIIRDPLHRQFCPWAAMVEMRCAADLPGINPWCYAGRPKTVDVILCFALKALIFGLLGSLAVNTDAPSILNAVLMRWNGDRSVSIAHIHTWSRVRESILRNDVKNILDRYENVVVMYTGFALYFVTDATIQIVIRNRPPSLSAGYIVLLFVGSFLVCLRQAMACHYMQMHHAETLMAMKEATYCLGYGSAAANVRDIIDVLVARITGGGDFQTKLVYLPLNPAFQKTLLGYVGIQFVAIITRLTFFSQFERA